jgi:hypothetical protein
MLSSNQNNKQMLKDNPNDRAEVFQAGCNIPLLKEHNLGLYYFKGDGFTIPESLMFLRDIDKIQTIDIDKAACASEAFPSYISVYEQ